MMHFSSCLFVYLKCLKGLLLQGYQLRFLCDHACKELPDDLIFVGKENRFLNLVDYINIQVFPNNIDE